MEEENQFKTDEIEVKELSDKYDKMLEEFTKPIPIEELNFKIAKNNLPKLEYIKEITKAGKYQQVKVNLNIVPECNTIETSNVYTARVIGFYITGQCDKYNVFITDSDGIDVLVDKGRNINKRRWNYENSGVVVGSKLTFKTNTDQLVQIFLYLE